MPNIEPTYLRHVYDGLRKGALNKENPSSLPYGLIGLYEKEFLQNIPLNKRSKVLNLLGVWALLKRPVSLGFVTHVLGTEEVLILEFIDEFSSWFNSPESGRYQLYHERLRIFVLSKLSDIEIAGITDRLLSALNGGEKSGELKEYYLHHYIDHLITTCYFGGKHTDYLQRIVEQDDFWDKSFLDLNSIQPAIENIRNIITYSVYSGDWQMLNRCAELILFLGQKNDILCEELLAEEKIDKEAIELCFDSISSSFDRLRFVSIATLKIIESTTESEIDQEWLEQLWIQLVGYVESEYVNGALILPYWAKIKLEKTAESLQMDSLSIVLEELDFDDVESLEEREFEFVYLTEDIEDYSDHDQRALAGLMAELRNSKVDFLKAFRYIDTPNLMDRDELICRAALECIEEDYKAYFDWIEWLLIESEFEIGEHAPPDEKYFSKNLLGVIIQRSNIEYLRKLESLIDKKTDVYQSIKLELRNWISDQYQVLFEKEKSISVLNKFAQALDSEDDFTEWKSAWYKGKNIPINLNELPPAYRLDALNKDSHSRNELTLEKVDELLKDLDNDIISKSEYLAETAVKLYHDNIGLSKELINAAWDLIAATSDWASIYAKAEVLAAGLNFMDENWMSVRIRIFESEFIELAEEEEFITNSLETFYYYKPYRFSDQNMLMLVSKSPSTIQFLKRIGEDGLARAFENEKNEQFIANQAEVSSSFREFWKTVRHFFNSDGVGVYIEEFWSLFGGNEEIFLSITAEDVRIINVISRKVGAHFPTENYLKYSERLQKYQDRIGIPNDWEFGSKKGFPAMLSEKIIDKETVCSAVFSSPRESLELTTTSINAVGYMLKEIMSNRGLVNDVKSFIELRTEVLYKHA